MLLYIFAVVGLLCYVIIVHYRIAVTGQRRFSLFHRSMKRELHQFKRECDLSINRLEAEFKARMLLLEARISHFEDDVDNMINTNRYSFPIEYQSKSILQFDHRLLQLQGLVDTQLDQPESKADIVISSSTLGESIEDGFVLTISAPEPSALEVSGTNNLNEVQSVTGLLTSASFKIRYTVPHQFSDHNWLITDRQSVHETHHHPVDGIDFATEVLK